MHSLEELIARAQKALVWDVVANVNATVSPNAADTAVKAMEYPSSVCTAARSLALLREHHFGHYTDLIRSVVRSPDDEKTANVRIFNCGWSHISGKEVYENEGTVHVYPKIGTPPLFWDYKVYNDNGTVLASTIRTERRVGIEDIKGIFSEGSQSIPLGLHFRIWPHSTNTDIEFTAANQFQRIVWVRRVDTDGNKLLMREAARSDMPRSVPRDQIIFTPKANEGSSPSKSELTFSRKIGATGWGGQGFSSDMRMVYRFIYPELPTTTATRSNHTILENSGGEATGQVVIVAKADSLVLNEQGYNTFPLASNIGEMLFSSEKINVRKTLENCFSFKFQEIEMLKCLA